MVTSPQLNTLFNKIFQTKEKKMTANNFHVNRSSRTDWDRDYFETLAEAETAARKRAWSSADEQIIYQAVATVDAPAFVNDVKINKL